MTPALRHGVGENKESKVATHFHVTTKPYLCYVVRKFVPADFAPGASYFECACEAGEIDLYHEGIEAREIGEECVCPDCERRRSARFILWREQQAAAGIVAEHTVPGEAGPDV